MRPLELRVRNFRSFSTASDDEVVFDFRGRRLVGVVGPIGSGKSTILDAIAFALYGRTPRINRATRSLVHQRSDSAAVALRFRIDGEVWEAVRSLRRKGQSQHALYRLPDDAPDVEPVEKIVMEGEVNERIEQLLGFDYGAFSRSVMLAQGQFAEFLTAAPGQRDRVLKGVFGHERLDVMRERAKEQAKEGEHELEKLQIRLGGATKATERIGQGRVELAAADERLAVLEARRPEVDELTTARAEVVERRRVAEAERSILLERAAQMPDAEQSDLLLTSAAEAADQRTRLADAVEAAHRAVTGAETVIRSDDHQARRTATAAADKLLTELESRQRELVQAKSQLKVAETRAEESGAAVAEASAGLETATTHAASMAEALDAASKRLVAARQLAHEAQHANMAGTLRAGLAAGAPCPVCAQDVQTVPAADTEIDLAALDADVADAAAHRTTTERANAEAGAAVAAAEQAVAGAIERQKEFAAHAETAKTVAEDAEAAVRGIEADLIGLLGDGDPHELMRAVQSVIDAESAAVDEARQHLDDRRRAHEASIAAEQETQRALSDLRSRVGAMARQIDPSADVPSDDPVELREALADVRSRWATAQTQLTEAIGVADQELVTLQQRLDAVFAELDIEDSFDAAVARSDAQASVLRDRIADDERLLADAEGLIAEHEERATEVELLRRLAGDLTDSRFIRYLLDEERTQLAELGSDHFQRLSSGRYRFTDGGDLEVLDLTSADAVRKADSLSGGETFLASLALALGLAEMVSRTGGRLEAFFLDEGFGSLDSEHLDLAMEGIERLVTDGADRLVVVVSHVAELKERLEDLIVLDRDPTTGDSRVVQG